MYSIAVRRDFIAQHFLIGGDWGPENEKHSHHYQVELQLEGASLDQHGYLVDIVDVEQHLNALVACYRDRTLNELAEFAGLNPSIEHFSRILAEKLAEALDPGVRYPHLRALTVRLWENDIAWASYRLPLNRE